MNMISWLVVSTHLKNMLVKLDHFPRDRGENTKDLSCHHLVRDAFFWIHLKDSIPKRERMIKGSQNIHVKAAVAPVVSQHAQHPNP